MENLNPVISEGFKSLKFDVIVYHHQNKLLLNNPTSIVASFGLLTDIDVSRLDFPLIPLLKNSGEKSVKTFQYKPPVVR